MARLRDWNPCANRGTKSGAVKVATNAAPLSEPTHGTNKMIVTSRTNQNQTFPGLSIDHGQICQFGKPRSVAMNGRGIHQVSLRTAEGRVLTLPVCRLFSWEA